MGAPLSGCLSVLLVALVAGCATAPGERWPDAAGPTVVLGTGEMDYEDLGDTVPLIAGPQGGYHVWISVRCFGLAPPVRIQYGERDADTGQDLTLGMLLEASALDDPGPWHVVPGLVGRLDGYDPKAFLERAITMWTSVTDAKGHVVADQHRTTIHGIEQYP